MIPRNSTRPHAMRSRFRSNNRPQPGCRLRGGRGDRHDQHHWAGLLAMRRAGEGLSLSPEHVLVDARRIKDLPIPQQSIVKGDCKSLSIAAASILAKTARDALMHKLDAQHPG